MTDRPAYEFLKTHPVRDHHYLPLAEYAKCIEKSGRQYSWCRYAKGTKYTTETYEQSVFSSKQQGKRATRKHFDNGRIIFDLFLFVQEMYKLNSYSLDNVSMHFLKDRKIGDVKHEETYKHQKNPEGRNHLAVYCLKDSWLSLIHI